MALVPPLFRFKISLAHHFLCAYRFITGCFEFMKHFSEKTKRDLYRPAGRHYTDHQDGSLFSHYALCSAALNAFVRPGGKRDRAARALLSYFVRTLDGPRHYPLVFTQCGVLIRTKFNSKQFTAFFCARGRDDLRHSQQKAIIMSLLDPSSLGVDTADLLVRNWTRCQISVF